MKIPFAQKNTRGLPIKLPVFSMQRVYHAIACSNKSGVKSTSHHHFT
jgi:hypothetical protein